MRSLSVPGRSGPAPGHHPHRFGSRLDAGASPRVVFDLLRGASVAHLRPVSAVALEVDGEERARLTLGSILLCWFLFAAAGLGLLAGCGRLPGQAAPPKVARIGLFHVGIDHVPPPLPGLQEGLQALGYVEGQNIEYDWRNLVDEEAARATAADFVLESTAEVQQFLNALANTQL